MTGFSYQPTKIVLRRPLESPQFTRVDFTGVLLKHGVAISMDGNAPGETPCSSSACGEASNTREVYLRAYDSLSEARSSIGRYLAFYNASAPAFEP